MFNQSTTPILNHDGNMVMDRDISIENITITTFRYIDIDKDIISLVLIDLRDISTNKINTVGSIIVVNDNHEITSSSNMVKGLVNHNTIHSIMVQHAIVNRCEFINPMLRVKRVFDLKVKEHKSMFSKLVA